jgi:hypothetical protein
MTDTPKPQADKFRDLARELEADEDEAAFEETVKKIVQAPTMGWAVYRLEPFRFEGPLPTKDAAEAAIHGRPGWRAAYGEFAGPDGFRPLKQT